MTSAVLGDPPPA